MSSQEKKIFLATYDWAAGWEDLPWAHAEPTLFLSEICRRRPAGRALDLGCGTGTDSIYLAEMGWQVTALDFIPRALEYTRQRAVGQGLELELVEADITTWEPPRLFDLVLDHGLLHNLDPVHHAAYRQRVLQALAPGGDLVLVHWHPLHAGQADGRMGPRRVDRQSLKNLFAPELQERFFACEEFEDLPDMVGGGMTQAFYWFRYNQTWQQPQELIRQLRATLERHGCTIEAAASDGHRLAPGHLARVLGPGRLGISHQLPAAGEALRVLEQWASHGGIDFEEALALVTAFASPELANVCNPGAPRCGECEVVFCKRLRQR